MLRKMKIDPLWAAVLLAAVVVLPALPAQMVRGQCVGGSCMSPQYRQPAATIAPHAKNQPTPAWRYEHPTGHRQAVVRIHCIDRQVGGRTERSIGSGVLVRVGGRLVVLTARHVVKDAKQIIVELFTKKTHRAVVLHVDATWDCAVLEMEGRPEGVEPAEIEWGEAATGYQNGERLESAGYGPDGKLAVNVGVFRGYRRSTAAGDGHDDWMEISGHARQGDSGGPVFNARGRVVGVLWGTDGETVMCVQPGRLHVVIESAMKYYRQNSTGGEPLVPVVFPQQRNPTPPMPGPVVQAQSSGPNGCGPGGCGPSPYNAMAKDRSPALPWRVDAERKDAAQDARIDRLLDAIERQAARPIQQPPPATAPKEEAKPEPIRAEANPILSGLSIFAAVGLGFVLYFAMPKK